MDATANRLSRIKDDIDNFNDGNHATPAQEVTAPSFGSPTNKAISSVVEGLVTNLIDKIKGLHHELNLIEQRAISSAEAAKHVLAEHVATCERINDEVARIHDVVSALAEKTRDL